MLKTDTSGVMLTADVKLSNAFTSWNTRLSKIANEPGKITICTYSLTDLRYVGRILERRHEGITVICNTAYESKAKKLKEFYPYVDFYTSPYAHAKLALIEPGTVWLSTENFGRGSDLFDASIAICSEAAYSHYYRQTENLLRRRDTVRIEEA